MGLLLLLGLCAVSLEHKHDSWFHSALYSVTTFIISSRQLNLKITYYSEEENI